MDLTHLFTSNFAPDDHERQHLLSLLSATCAVSAAADRMVDLADQEPDRARDNLTDREESVQCKPEALHVLQQIRCALSGVRRLPAEILQLIFQLTLPESRHGRLMEESPLLLLMVCRFWRDVALATPELWTNIRIVCDPYEEGPDIDPGNPARIRHEQVIRAAEQWAARSHPYPLDIYVEGEVVQHNWRTDVHSGVRQALKAMLPYVQRWRRLEIIAMAKDLQPLESLRGVDLPSLTAFGFQERGHDPISLFYVGTYIKGAPKLSSLRVGSATCRQSLSLRCVANSRLLVDVHVRATYASNNDLDVLRHAFACLQRFVNLEQLSIELERSRRNFIVIAGPHTQFPVVKPARLPRLRRLQVTCDDRAATVTFLDRIQAPHLAELEYRNKRHENIPPLASFLARSKAPVKTMRLGIKRWHKDYDECLELVPKLEHLVVTGLVPRIAKAIQRNLLAPALDWETDLCPRLRSLKMTDVWGVDELWLWGFLRERSRRHEGQAKLQSVEVRFGVKLREDLLERISAYSERGIDVKFSYVE
ncbi:hypothetical protein K525DRAFT_211539 [Schizophyllum commune Loenen D]|nr:hypothetical protein K525DRAFT_211539 [Schizophyllum commune Loenen D]